MITFRPRFRRLPNHSPKGIFIRAMRKRLVKMIKGRKSGYRP